MAKNEDQYVDLDFAFFRYLREFYIDRRGTVRKHFREVSKRFLDFNDPSNGDVFLRVPQFEALEMYIFLKEYLENAPMHTIFKEWYHKSGRFVGRKDAGLPGEQLSLLGDINEKQYKSVFARMSHFAQRYPNYIFALTMGTGKTILMATCIYYEFILANRSPKDPKYCHNALVFAPDKTVLQSLKEMQTFNLRRVVPPEYASWVTSQVKFHFLDDSGITLNTLDLSEFNIIISNTQKIILKRQRKEQTVQQQLFKTDRLSYQAKSVYERYADLYDIDTLEDEKDLTINQRFLKLSHLEQLGIYVDEAHHAFGDQLAKDLGHKKASTSLRLTINELAANLERYGTRVVACYNFTGTPYVGREILPEVVYGYGLKEAINMGYLKDVEIHGYTNPKSAEFVRLAVRNFMENYDGTLHEGMIPKLAFFASTIEELNEELRPAVESALTQEGIPHSRILTNVGDSKLTSNDDIREFNRLDTDKSEKQFILLVNKGREGWNCRSLFGVALFRTPKSRIFVLQATMRCLRAIGPIQQTASVYLSHENEDILNEELQQNFRISVNELRKKDKGKVIYQVHPIPPPVKITLKRVKRLHQLKERKLLPGVDLELGKADIEKYRLIHTVREGVTPQDGHSSVMLKEDLTAFRERRIFSEVTLVAEIARYLNRPCLQIEDVLRNSKDGMDNIVRAVNDFNELIYDWIIPRLFSIFFELVSYRSDDEEEIDLVKIPEQGYYEIRSDPDLVVLREDELAGKYADKSFHLDAYCFDSQPENKLFWKLLTSREVNKVYFTGMLTHGQSDFYVHYIDPDSHTVRSYYPDFLVQKNDGSWIIVEVKGDNKIEDPVVLAKAESARQMAVASKMTYRIIKGSEASAGEYMSILTAKDRFGE